MHTTADTSFSVWYIGAFSAHPIPQITPLIEFLRTVSLQSTLSECIPTPCPKMLLPYKVRAQLLDYRSFWGSRARLFHQGSFWGSRRDYSMSGVSEDLVYNNSTIWVFEDPIRYFPLTLFFEDPGHNLYTLGIRVDPVPLSKSRVSEGLVCDYFTSGVL